MGKTIKVGQKVFAKWPGSNRYYEAVVDDVLENDFVVSFIEGSLTTTVDEKHVYNERYFRSRSSSPARKRSSSPARRQRSRSRSPSRRKTSTPKKSPRRSPTRRGRSPGRPRKEERSDTEEEKIEKPTKRRASRSRKQEPDEKPKEQAPVKTKQVEEQVVTHLTRSMTKSMDKEEKEALFDKDKLDQELKEARKGKAKEFEFGGPVGVFFMMLALPVLVYAMYFYCNGKSSKCSFFKNPQKLPNWRVFFNMNACLIYDGWLLFQLILYFVPIGKIVQGQVQPDGTRKSYRMNGLLALIGTIAGLFALKAKKAPLNMVYDNMPSLITVAMLCSLLVAIFVYIKAKRDGTGLASNTGNVLYDFFIGHQLNPSIGSFDFKFFCETRPSLLGWMVINFCMASHQFDSLNKVSPAMMMVCFFQFIYVMDIMIFETTLLSQMDFTHDGFGFMLSFGNLVFVPFLFSTQTRFLADHNVHIAWPYIVAIIVLKVIGYVIFRGSNLQKDFFRREPNDPDFKDKETILTPSGKRLMVFGWWKMVRHPNYFGDILMAIAWSLPCGFTHVIPWFYPLYLVLLLVHRERRDEALCRKKYGKSYDEYCRRVPYRIIPFVY